MAEMELITSEEFLKRIAALDFAMPQEIFNLLSPDQQEAVQEAQRDRSLANYQGPYIEVTTASMCGLLEGYNGFLSMRFCTEPKLTKKDRETQEPNPYGIILKKWSANCVFGINWAKHINRLLEKLGVSEPDYVAGERANGTVPVDNKFSTKEVKAKDGSVYDQWYLSLTPLVYLNETEYIDKATGNSIPEKALKNFLPSRSTPSKFEKYGLTPERLKEAGLGSIPKFLTVKVESVTHFKLRGKFYKVIQ